MRSGVKLRFREHYCRILFDADTPVLVLAGEEEATLFPSADAAWRAACRHHLDPDFVTVQSVTAEQKPRANP
jgi:hypothetical protein